MMFHLFTFHLLLVTLIARIGFVESACLPCQRRFNGHPELVRRVVYSPKITKPDSSTIWTVGSHVTVEWNCDDMPEKITNTKGTIVLGTIKEGGKEHLDLKNPLAHGFDIRQRKITLKVPRVKPGNTYIIVLFGDSGNRSSPFRIKGIHHGK